MSSSMPAFGLHARDQHRRHWRRGGRPRSRWRAGDRRDGGGCARRRRRARPRPARWRPRPGGPSAPRPRPAARRGRRIRSRGSGHARAAWRSEGGNCWSPDRSRPAPAPAPAAPAAADGAWRDFGRVHWGWPIYCRRRLAQPCRRHASAAAEAHAGAEPVQIAAARWPAGSANHGLKRRKGWSKRAARAQRPGRWGIV